MAPPYAKKEIPLAISVICQYFVQINKYYGFPHGSWSVSTSSSSSTDTSI